MAHIVAPGNRMCMWFVSATRLFMAMPFWEEEKKEEDEKGTWFRKG